MSSVKRRWLSSPLGRVAVGIVSVALVAIPASLSRASDTFTDVSSSNTFHGSINALVDSGVTGGCSVSPPKYCPGSFVTRGQMAGFLDRLGALSAGRLTVVNAFLLNNLFIVGFEESFTLAGGARTECETTETLFGTTNDPDDLLLEPQGAYQVTHQLFGVPGVTETSLINVQLGDTIGDENESYDVCFSHIDDASTLAAGDYDTYGTYVVDLSLVEVAGAAAAGNDNGSSLDPDAFVRDFVHQVLEQGK